MVYQFKIQIEDIVNPPVWRRIAVPANFTFRDFHNAIQLVFGWENCHLFEFCDKTRQSKIRISIPSKDDDIFDFGMLTKNLDASKTKLSKIFSAEFKSFQYRYDLGDNWTHDITLEEISYKKQERMVILAGEGACPPEDCGGVHSYEEMKRVFEIEPDSEEADSYREWIGLKKGGKWNANAFNLDSLKLLLE